MLKNDYEIERQRRINANKTRMAQMGLSQTVQEITNTALFSKVKARQERAARKAAVNTTAAAPPLPRRRSQRVQGQPAPEYDSNALQDDLNGGRLQAPENEEQYTMQHVRALGTRSQEWTLFVDGYDAEGNRVYDKVQGQTCHQCRQKTLGKRTACSRCTSLQGVFCGDCLYMRYGENVDEATANAEWICPPCRDLCNCSFHRSRKGWAPTGTLYRRAVAAGYLSVAHYLVLNNLVSEARKEALEFMPEILAAEVKAELEAELEAELNNGDGGLEEQLENSAKRSREEDVSNAAQIGVRRRRQSLLGDGN